jgi:hypothetical protein
VRRRGAVLVRGHGGASSGHGEGAVQPLAAVPMAAAQDLVAVRADDGESLVSRADEGVAVAGQHGGRLDVPRPAAMAGRRVDRDDLPGGTAARPERHARRRESSPSSEHGRSVRRAPGFAGGTRRPRRRPAPRRVRRRSPRWGTFQRERATLGVVDVDPVGDPLDELPVDDLMRSVGPEPGGRRTIRRAGQSPRPDQGARPGTGVGEFRRGSPRRGVLGSHRWIRVVVVVVAAGHENSKHRRRRARQRPDPPMTRGSGPVVRRLSRSWSPRRSC